MRFIGMFKADNHILTMFIINQSRSALIKTFGHLKACTTKQAISRRQLKGVTTGPTARIGNKRQILPARRADPRIIPNGLITVPANRREQVIYALGKKIWHQFFHHTHIAMLIDLVIKKQSAITRKLSRVYWVPA